MGHLPRSVPDADRQEMAEALAAAGITLGGTKPGTRVTHLVQHDGRTWELTFMGRRYGWRATGPGAEHGRGVDPAEAAALIATPPAEPEPEPADPHPGVPRTYLSIPVPALVRARWTSELADGWRLGVRSHRAAR